MRHTRLLCSAGLLLAACGTPPPPEDYRQQIEQGREARVERLTSETGYLTLVGLHWLEPGGNPFGSDPELPIVLTGDGVPARAGTFVYEGGVVRLEAEPDSGITLDGAPVSERVLRDDNQSDKDVLHLGRLQFYVIKRGAKHGVRVKDPQSSIRTGFGGLDYFPVSRAFRVVGRFERFVEPRQIPVPTVLGTVEPMLSPGEVTFRIDGAEHSLLPIVDEPDDTDFFFIFRDQTSGRESYGAGRFLSADLEGDQVALDFNLAYNPPCAFTPHATCPLPPRENWLATRIEAGERVYGSH